MELLNAASGAYAAGRYRQAGELIDAAAELPGAAQHPKRIREAKRLVTLAGGYDRCWVPPVSHWKRCPATDTACPHGDADCAGVVCALKEGGWP